MRTKPRSETPFDVAEVAGGGVVDDAELPAAITGMDSSAATTLMAATPM